jgi:hypothetical protein
MPKKKSLETTSDSDVNNLQLKALVLISNRLAEVADEIKLLREHLATNSIKEKSAE